MKLSDVSRFAAILILAICPFYNMAKWNVIESQAFHKAPAQPFKLIPARELRLQETANVSPWISTQGLYSPVFFMSRYLQGKTVYRSEEFPHSYSPYYGKWVRRDYSFDPFVLAGINSQTIPKIEFDPAQLEGHPSRTLKLTDPRSFTIVLNEDGSAQEGPYYFARGKDEHSYLVPCKILKDPCVKSGGAAR